MVTVVLRHTMAMADVARPVLQELHEPDDLLSLNARKPADALKTPVAPIRHKRPRLSLSPPPPKRRLCLGLMASGGGGEGPVCSISQRAPWSWDSGVGWWR